MSRSTAPGAGGPERDPLVDALGRLHRLDPPPGPPVDETVAAVRRRVHRQQTVVRAGALGLAAAAAVALVAVPRLGGDGSVRLDQQAADDSGVVASHTPTPRPTGSVQPTPPPVSQ